MKRAPFLVVIGTGILVVAFILAWTVARKDKAPANTMPHRMAKDTDGAGDRPQERPSPVGPRDIRSIVQTNVHVSSSTGLTNEGVSVINRSTEMREKYRRRVQEKIAGRSTAEAVLAMDDFVKELRAEGEEFRMIEAVIGAPSSVEGSTNIYRFDTGEGGWEWRIEIKDGRTVRISKIGLD